MSARSGLLAAALYILCAAGCVEGPRHDGSPLRCAIGIPSDPSGNDLRCGYNYEMLRRYADAEGRDISIRLAGKREQVLDSLRHGVLDIVSLPYSDKLAADTTQQDTAAKVDGSGIEISAMGGMGGGRDDRRRQ